jgi:tetratricopeptide (TPR) repeat protein
MNFIYLLILYCILLVKALCCQSNSNYNLIDSAKYYLVNQEYEKCKSLCEKILKKNPREINAIYFLYASQQIKIMDYEVYNIFFDSLIFISQKYSDILKKELAFQKSHDSLNCLFYIASIYGNLGVIYAKNNNWPLAIQKSINSISILKEIIKKSPKYYQAYLGIGLFNYYVSQNFKILPFFKDKTKEGINQIILSTNSEFPFSYVAKNSLCWILIEQGDYYKADSIVSIIISELPQNSIFIRIKAKIAFEMKRWEDAILWSKKLIEISSKRNPKNYNDIFSGYYFMALSYYNMGKKNESLKACNLALCITTPEPYSRIDYINKHIKAIKEIKEKCQ